MDSIGEALEMLNDVVITTGKAQTHDDSESALVYNNEYIDQYFNTQKGLPINVQEDLAVANMYIEKIYKRNPEDKFFKRYLPLVTETLEATVSAENYQEIRSTAKMLSEASKKYYGQITGSSMMTVDVNKSVLEQLLTQDGLYNTIDDVVDRVR